MTSTHSAATPAMLESGAMAAVGEPVARARAMHDPRESLNLHHTKALLAAYDAVCAQRDAEMRLAFEAEARAVRVIGAQQQAWLAGGGEAPAPESVLRPLYDAIRAALTARATATTADDAMRAVLTSGPAPREPVEIEALRASTARVHDGTLDALRDVVDITAPVAALAMIDYLTARSTQLQQLRDVILEAIAVAEGAAGDAVLRPSAAMIAHGDMDRFADRMDLSILPAIVAYLDQLTARSDILRRVAEVVVEPAYSSCHYSTGDRRVTKSEFQRLSAEAELTEYRTRARALKSAMHRIRWSPGLHIPGVGRLGWRRTLLVMHALGSALRGAKAMEWFAISTWGPFALVYDRSKRARAQNATTMESTKASAT